ncbi:hypothetical protein D3C75_543590 [compost metagenome]
MQRSHAGGRGIGDKLPVVCRRDFEVVLDFTLFDKGPEKLQRPVVIDKLEPGGSFIHHRLQHLATIVGP